MQDPAFTATTAASIADAIPRLLALALALAAAAVLVVAPGARAADKPADTVPGEVRGVELGLDLLPVCGVVSDVRTETRDAPASGKGAVAGGRGRLGGPRRGPGGLAPAGRPRRSSVRSAEARPAMRSRRMHRVTVWTTTVVLAKDGTVRAYERLGPEGRARRRSSHCRTAVQPGRALIQAQGSAAHPHRRSRHGNLDAGRRPPRRTLVVRTGRGVADRFFLVTLAVLRLGGLSRRPGHDRRDPRHRDRRLRMPGDLAVRATAMGLAYGLWPIAWIIVARCSSTN